MTPVTPVRTRYSDTLAENRGERRVQDRATENLKTRVDTPRTRSGHASDTEARGREGATVSEGVPPSHREGDTRTRRPDPVEVTARE